MHAPHAFAVQVCVPRLQIPWVLWGPQGWVALVTQVQPSFGVPLQFASSPDVAQPSEV